MLLLDTLQSILFLTLHLILLILWLPYKIYCFIFSMVYESKKVGVKNTPKDSKALEDKKLKYEKTSNKKKGWLK